VTGTVLIEADRLVYEDGRVEASGQVTVVWEDQRVEGERAVLDGRALVVESGRWVRGADTLVFSSARVNLDTREGELRGLGVTVDGARLDAEGLSLRPDGTWGLTDGRLEPCQCPDGERPALSFRAARAEVVPGEYVVLHGATARVFDVPVLPVPWWRVPLDRDRFRLLFPELGYGAPGLSASWESEGTVAGWTVRGGPAVRQDRGFRGLLSVRGPAASGAGELGWDGVEARVRGLGVSRGGLVAETPAPLGPPARLAWDVAVASDATYADDYAVDYVARGVAWRESRGVAEWGPARLVTALPDDGSRAALVGGRVRAELGRGGAWGVAPFLEGGVVGSLPPVRGGAAVEAVGASPALRGGLELRGSATAGPVHTELRGEGWLGAAPEEGLAWGGRGVGRVELPAWGDLGSWRAQGWLGGTTRVEVAEPVGAGASGGILWGADGQLRTAAIEPLVAGPSLRVEAAGAPGVVQTELVAGFAADGDFVPSGTLAVRAGPVDLDLGADPDQQRVRVGVREGAVSVSVGSLRAEPLWLAWGDVDLAPGRVRAGGGLTWDLGEAGWSGASARLGYDDGCAAAMLTAGFGPDRTLPDLGLSLRLRR